jgi:hypothetical protein
MSNILKNVFKMTNDIKSNPLRETINSCYKELQNSNGLGNSIGYHGRQLYKQFLGYLLIYDNREKINSELPYKIPELPNEIIESLVKGHSYIKKINRSCLNPLLTLLPNAYKILDPYWENERTKDFSSTIDIQGDGFQSLLQSFQLDSTYQILKNRLQYIPKFIEVKEDDLAKAIYSALARIREFGLKHCPDDILQLSMSINKKVPEYISGSILFALIHIYASLQCIDQIIFQAFIDTKLSCFDESNIFKIETIQSNALSNIVEFKTTRAFFFPGEVIIIKLPRSNLPFEEEFYYVENVETKVSQEFGEEGMIGARAINNKACYYSNLMRPVKTI